MKIPKEINNSKFCQLHAHSVYSQRDGAITIRDLVDTTADKYGQKAVAVSDHGIVSSGYVLYQNALHLRPQRGAEPIKPIIGCELYINDTRQELFDWLPKAQEVEKEERAKIRNSLAKYYHGLLIAKNRTGYYNLIKIHNEAWQNFYHRPMTTPELLWENTEGLIYSTACMSGHIPFFIQKQGDMDTALRLIDQYKEAFGEDFFIELMPIRSELQKGLNEILIDISRKKKVPLIVTNDSHYLEAEDHGLHTALLNLDRLKKTLKSGKSPDALWEFDVDDLWLKDAEAMYRSWYEYHRSDVFTEAVFIEAMENVARVIDSIGSYDLEAQPKVPKIFDDEWQAIKDFVADGLQRKVKKGVIPARGHTLEEYIERIKMELEVFKLTRTLDYMLCCYDFVKWAKDNDVEVGAGRGSVGSCLIAYLLGITEIDPIRWGLFLERFINKSRIAKLDFSLG